MGPVCRGSELLPAGDAAVYAMTPATVKCAGRSRAVSSVRRVPMPGRCLCGAGLSSAERPCPTLHAVGSCAAGACAAGPGGVCAGVLCGGRGAFGACSLAGRRMRAACSAADAGPRAPPAAGLLVVSALFGQTELYALDAVEYVLCRAESRARGVGRAQYFRRQPRQHVRFWA